MCNAVLPGGLRKSAVWTNNAFHHPKSLPTDLKLAKPPSKTIVVSCQGNDTSSKRVLILTMVSHGDMCASYIRHGTFTTFEYTTKISYFRCARAALFLLFVQRCGWPLKTGDMYGGNHYILSAAADMTPQGRAIAEAASKFGDGKTLPFPPCKKYFNPHAKNGDRLYACRLHSELRMERVKKEGGKWRNGEKPLDDFWSNSKDKGKNGEFPSLKVNEYVKSDTVFDESTRTKKSKLDCGNLLKSYDD